MKRLKRIAAAMGGLLLLRIGCIAATPGVNDLDDSEKRFNAVSERLITGERGWGPSAFYAGEWHIVSLSMTSIAALNLSRAKPETREQRRRIVERLAADVLRPETRAFDRQRYGDDDALQTLEHGEGHAGSLGHIGLVLGVECLLGGDGHREVHDAVANALRRRFESSQNGLIDTYPHQQWLPDNAAALAAVELHAQCRGLPSLRPVTAKWPRHQSGLFRFTPSHREPRGSGAGFISVYLPLIDESLAREQWHLLEQRYVTRPLPGTAAVREWPLGDARAGDVDSGPLVFGLSPSGTGFGLAGAAFAHDDATADGMLRTAEAAGFTVGGLYRFGPLVGDASVLAARTHRLVKPISGVVRSTPHASCERDCSPPPCCSAPRYAPRCVDPAHAGSRRPADSAVAAAD